MTIEGPRTSIRPARLQDLAGLVEMLADDPLGKAREQAQDGPTAPDSGYERAFANIDADPNNLILVADQDGRAVGCLQLTFIPGLTYRGAPRAQIEGVRTSNTVRGQGLGRSLVAHAIGLAKARGCVLMQLTTDKRRPDALEFYRALGFTASHEGLKIWF